jgi:microtubule-associated serine/threonine kinase
VLGGRFSKAGRCKSTTSIPPSPLACIPPPQPLSPPCSPASVSLPAGGHAKALHGYHPHHHHHHHPGKTLSPPTVARHAGRPRSAEPQRSPLLKRVQSAEKLNVYHGDKKAFATRRHTMEAPLSEGEGQEDLEADAAASGFVCVGEHGRQGLYVSPQQHRRSNSLSSGCGGGGGGGVSRRSNDVVVMRKLALSERRDSFKKQEAVQEVSFDDLDEKGSPAPVVSGRPPKGGFMASWIHPAQWEEELGVRGGGGASAQGKPQPQPKARSKEKDGS